MGNAYEYLIIGRFRVRNPFVHSIPFHSIIPWSGVPGWANDPYLEENIAGVP